MSSQEQVLVAEMSVLTRYLSPCSMIIILASLALSLPETSVIVSVIELLAFSVLFNIASSAVARKVPAKSALIAKVRLPTNFALNVVFLWILGPYSDIIWMLFIFMPLGMAVYGTFRKTLVAGLVSAGTLIVIYHFRGVATWEATGAAVVQSSLIIFLSLFVSKLKLILVQALSKPT